MKQSVRIYQYVIVGLVIVILLSMGLNIFALISRRNDRSDFDNTISNLQAEIQVQQRDKNTVRGIWEEQVSKVDKMEIAEENVENRINAYVLEVKRSVRFVNGIPEILPTANEQRLTDTEKELLFEIENMREKSNESAIFAQDSKETIDALYLTLGEEQDNRANPREE